MCSPVIFSSVTFRIYITLAFSIFLFVVAAVPMALATSAENNNNNNDDIINKSGNGLVIINFDDSYDSQSYGNGWNNQTVLDITARYYDIARTNGYDALTFLNCDRWNGINYTIKANDSYNSRSSCVREEGQHLADSEISPNRAINLQQTLGSSRYALNSWSHKHIAGPYDYGNLSCIDTCMKYNNSQMLDRFVEIVNSQNNFNKDGTVRAIPIIVYHAFVPYNDVSESRIPTDTNVNLFEQEMKYLRDNGFKTLTMKDLRYDEKRDTLVIRNNDQ